MEKKRSLINVKTGLDENEILTITKNDEVVKKYLDNKKIKKNIYVKDKLINLIV